MIARLVALAALGSAVLAVLLVTGGDGPVLRAELPTADGLREGSVVRVGGVDVGRVAELEVTEEDTVMTRLELDEGLPPVGRDARVRIRAANLLGEKYVDLDTGDGSRPLGEGETIPPDRVRTSVEIDDVLDVLDPSTRTRLAILLREAGIALGGRGDELKSALRRMPRTLEDLEALFAEVGEDTEVLRLLVERSDRVVASVARERADLGELVETASEALTTFGERREGLGASLRELHPTLRRLRATLRSLDATGAALRPAADGLRATAPALTTTLDALPGFTTAARPALATTRRVAPALARLGEEGAPVVRRLRPAAQTLEWLGRDADALTGALDLGAADLLGTMENWARAIQQKDGVSHIFRVSASLDPTVLEALSEYVEGAPEPARRPRRPRAPRQDDAPGPTGAPAPRPQKPPRPILPALTEIDLPEVAGEALQKTDETVTGLLDYLLAP